MCPLQLRVTVVDNGNPEKTATATLNITVTKNVNAPKYAQASYEATVNENAPVGISLVKVSATDADNVCTALLLYLAYSVG